MPMRMCLEMVNRSLKIQMGVVENLLVQVGEFIISTNFVVLKMDHAREIPLILGYIS